MKIKWTVINISFFIAIHNAFIHLDSNSSISVTTQIYTHVHMNFFFSLQWPIQTTPKNLPRMQSARAIPVTWLGSGSCQPSLWGWILMNEWPIILRLKIWTFPPESSCALFLEVWAVNQPRLLRNARPLALNHVRSNLTLFSDTPLYPHFEHSSVCFMYTKPFSPILYCRAFPMKRLNNSTFSLTASFGRRYDIV